MAVFSLCLNELPLYTTYVYMFINEKNPIERFLNQKFFSNIKKDSNDQTQILEQTPKPDTKFALCLLEV